MFFLDSNYAPQWLRLKWTKLKKGVPNYQQLSFEGLSRVYSDPVNPKLQIYLLLVNCNTFV